MIVKFAVVVYNVLFTVQSVNNRRFKVREYTLPKYITSCNLHMSYVIIIQFHEYHPFRLAEIIAPITEWMKKNITPTSGSSFCWMSRSLHYRG